MEDQDRVGKQQIKQVVSARSSQLGGSERAPASVRRAPIARLCGGKAPKQAVQEEARDRIPVQRADVVAPQKSVHDQLPVGPLAIPHLAVITCCDKPKSSDPRRSRQDRINLKLPAAAPGTATGTRSGHRDSTRPASSSRRLGKHCRCGTRSRGAASVYDQAW